MQPAGSARGTQTPHEAAPKWRGAGFLGPKSHSPFCPNTKGCLSSFHYLSTHGSGASAGATAESSFRMLRSYNQRPVSRSDRQTVISRKSPSFGQHSGSTRRKSLRATDATVSEPRAAEATAAVGARWAGSEAHVAARAGPGLWIPTRPRSTSLPARPTPPRSPRLCRKFDWGRVSPTPSLFFSGLFRGPWIHPTFRASPGKPAGVLPGVRGAVGHRGKAEPSDP